MNVNIAVIPLKLKKFSQPRTKNFVNMMYNTNLKNFSLKLQQLEYRTFKFHKNKKITKFKLQNGMKPKNRILKMKTLNLQRIQMK